MLLDMVMLATGMRESFRELLVSRGFDLRLAPKGTLPFDTDATIPGVAAITSVLRNNPDIREISPVLGASIHIPIRNREGAGQGDVSSAVHDSGPQRRGSRSRTRMDRNVHPERVGDLDCNGDRAGRSKTQLLPAARFHIGRGESLRWFSAGYDTCYRLGQRTLGRDCRHARDRSVASARRSAGSARGRRDQLRRCANWPRTRIGYRALPQRDSVGVSGFADGDRLFSVSAQFSVDGA